MRNLFTNESTHAFTNYVSSLQRQLFFYSAGQSQLAFSCRGLSAVTVFFFLTPQAVFREPTVEKLYDNNAYIFVAAIVKVCSSVRHALQATLAKCDYVVSMY